MQRSSNSWQESRAAADAEAGRNPEKTPAACRRFYSGSAADAARRPSTLNRAGREAGDVVVEEEDVEDDDGDRAEHRARHELSPVVDIAADQLLRHAHADRDLV